MHTSTAEPIGNERFAAAMQTPPGHIGLMGLLFPWAGPGSGGVIGGGGEGRCVSVNGSNKSVKNAAFSGYGGGLSTKLGEWSCRLWCCLFVCRVILHVLWCEAVSEITTAHYEVDTSSPFVLLV